MAGAGAGGTIFNGDFIKALKSNLKLGDEGQVLYGDTDDPNSVAKDAPAGSIYVQKTTGVVYFKQDAGSTTSWRKLDVDYNTIHFGSADFQLASEYTTGQNATFDNGGSLGGTFARSTTAADLIRNVGSFKLNGTPVTNDWIASAAIDIPIGLRGRDLGAKMRIKSDFATGTVNIIVKDHTNTVILYDQPITNANDLNQAQDIQVLFYCPPTCTQVKVGIHVKTGAASTFIFDDVEVTADVVTSEELVDITEWKDFQLAAVSNWSGNATITSQYKRIADVLHVRQRFNFTSAPTGTLYVDLPTVDGVQLNIDTGKFMLPTVTYGASLVSTLSILDTGVVDFSGSGGVVYVKSDATTRLRPRVQIDSGSFERMVAITPTVPMTWANTDEMTFEYSVPIAEWSVSSSHIITPARVNLTEATEFDLVLNSTTGVNAGNTTGFWTRQGDRIFVEGRVYWSAAGAAATWTCDLPIVGGVQLTMGSLPGFDRFSACIGQSYFFNSGGTSENMNVVPNTSTAIQLVQDNGSSFDPSTKTSANDRSTFQYSCPILEWANSSTTFLAALPGSQAAQYTKTASQTLNNGSQTRLDFETKVTDTLGGILAITTGASWEAEALKAATFLIMPKINIVDDEYDDGDQVSMTLLVDTGGGYVSIAEFYKFVKDYSGTTTSRWDVRGSRILKMAKGDKFYISLFQNFGANSHAGNASQVLDIIKLGVA